MCASVFLAAPPLQGCARLKVEQVYKMPKAGSAMLHGLPKWPLSSSVTSSHGSNSSPGSRIVGIHSEGAEQQMEVRGRGGTCPGGHTLAGQPPGLQISASQTVWSTGCSRGESQLQEGAPSPVLPQQTAASPPLPPPTSQEAIPNPGPGTGVERRSREEKQGMVTAFSQAGHLAVCLVDGGAPYLGPCI